jgi:hypothetical protein
MKPLRLLLALLALLAARAHAAPRSELICGLAAGGLIQIDGILDDWGNLPELTKAGRDPADAALAVRCVHDAQALYLLVNVTDDRLIRTRQKTHDEDHLVLTFGGEALEIYPASGDQGAKLSVAWTGKGKNLPRPQVADSRQRRGWAVELALPLRGLPGYARGAPSVTATVTLHDVDSFTDRRVEEVVETGEIALTFEEAAATLTAFLDAQKLRRSDVLLDEVAELDGDEGRKRIVAAGKVIGLLGDGYSYLELPVAGPRDVLSVELADLTGTGRRSLIIRTVERGNGGQREVLSVWNARHGEWNRAFAHELAKQAGRSRLTNRWELVPRGRGKKGLDLVIRPGEVVGFTPETWNETPASDMAPILLPWGGKREEVWHFDGDQVSGG